MNAFEKYLLFLPRAEAVDHVIDCLKNGPPNNEAWNLMERFNGEWKCKPVQLPHLVLMTLVRLSEESQGQAK